MRNLPFTIETAGRLDAWILVGKTLHAEDAAAVCSLHGKHTRIKYGNLIVYYQNVDGDAGNSYDGVAALINDRIRRGGPSSKWFGK